MIRVNHILFILIGVIDASLHVLQTYEKITISIIYMSKKNVLLQTNIV